MQGDKRKRCQCRCLIPRCVRAVFRCERGHRLIDVPLGLGDAPRRHTPGARVRQQHREFSPAVTAQNILAPDHLLNDPGDMNLFLLGGEGTGAPEKEEQRQGADQPKEKGKPTASVRRGPVGQLGFIR